MIILHNFTALNFESYYATYVNLQYIAFRRL